MNSETRNIIKRNNLKLTKSLGQNFLIDENVIRNIVKSGEVTQEDLVIEIGPGIGNMTLELVKNAGHVIAIEIDKKLIYPLTERMSGYENFTLLNEDVLKADIEKIVDEKNKRNLKNVKVIANLPYYITTPIIMRFLEMELDVSSLVFMVQKEVADRMTAKAGKKEYGSITLAVQYYTYPMIEFDVSPHCFIPKPDVTSTIIKLEVYKKKPVEPNDKKIFFKTIKAAFSQRRKKLLNALVNSKYFTLEKNEFEEILEELNLDSNIRGERLEIMQFAELADAIERKSNKN